MGSARAVTSAAPQVTHDKELLDAETKAGEEDATGSA